MTKQRNHRQHVVTVALVVGAGLGLSYLTDILGPATPRANSVAQAAGGDPPCPMTVPDPEPGPARPWEADLTVGTYTQANLRNGNLFTAIPIVGWSGSGPGVAMTLYHNAANVSSSLDLTRGMGFDPGDGWTTSYSAHLILPPPGGSTAVTAIADDGTQDVYNLINGQWEAPPGVFDVLTREVNAEGDNVWRLTHKDQSYHEFDFEGLLAQIVDATDNALIITREEDRPRGEPRRIDFITDAAGRILEFTYDADGKLTQIQDPREPGEPDNSAGLGNRVWAFTYDANGRLETLSDPMSFPVGFAYDSAGRITALTDKDDHTYDYAYSAGRIAIVTDPQGSFGEGEPAPPRLTQRFTYVCETTAPQTKTTFRDRRGSDWIHLHDAARDFVALINPLGARQELGFDADHNYTLYRDALGNEWTSTYDDRGNLLTLVDPLTNGHVWTYDGFNNVTTYTDPGGNVVAFNYEHLISEGYAADYPTLLTSIQPLDAQGVPESTTALEYYTTSVPPASNGLVNKVIDANGVWTGFEYDQWGQPAKYQEGTPLMRGAAYIIDIVMKYDTGGRLYGGSSPSSAGGITNDANGRATASTCKLERAIVPPVVPSGFPDLPCDAPALPIHAAEWTALYTNMGRQTHVNMTLKTGSPPDDNRTHTAEYDELGLASARAIESSEWGDGVIRSFVYTHDWAAGEHTRSGPDGVETYTLTDAAGRVQFYRRGPAADPLMTAAYTYYADDRVQRIVYGNMAWVEYTYDAARRLTRIEHKKPNGARLLLLEYAYDARDLPTVITETDEAGFVTTVTFDYDNRGRLIREERIGDVGYDLDYFYDQVGNRTRKVDALNQREVVYHYDLEDPGTYGSDNNRLEFYETFDTTDPANPVLLSTTWYYYNESGNVMRVVTNVAGTDRYDATRLVYAGNGQAVTFVLDESWTWNGVPGSCPTAYDIAYGREFRYDGARQRYLDRRFTLIEIGGMWVPKWESKTWSDYDGDDIYGDFTVALDNPPTATDVRSFEPGLGRFGWMDDGSGSAIPDPSTVAHYHSDMIGTTRSMTDSSGTGVSPVT